VRTESWLELKGNRQSAKHYTYTTVRASVSRQHLLCTLFRFDNWSSSDTWSGQNSIYALYQTLHVNTRHCDLAPTTSTTFASWQDVTRLNCWSWLRTGMSGKNLWSSGGLTHTAIQLERERDSYFLYRSKGLWPMEVEAPVPKTSSIRFTVSIELSLVIDRHITV